MALQAFDEGCPAESFQCPGIVVLMHHLGESRSVSHAEMGEIALWKCNHPKLKIACLPVK